MRLLVVCGILAEFLAKYLRIRIFHEEIFRDLKHEIVFRKLRRYYS